jgi:hypothetical protein
MSESRPRRTFSKKDSTNSDSTSFCSAKNSAQKVISTQKIESSRLIDHLYVRKASLPE